MEKTGEALVRGIASGADEGDVGENLDGIGIGVEVRSESERGLGQGVRGYGAGAGFTEEKLQGDASAIPTWLWREIA